MLHTPSRIAWWIVVALVSLSTIARADGDPVPAEPRAWIGVTPALAGTSIRRFLASSGRGIMLRRVADGGPADRAGLRARDTILRWDGREVRSWSELRRWIGSAEPGTRVAVRVARRDWSACHGWSEHDLELVIGHAPR